MQTRYFHSLPTVALATLLALTACSPSSSGDSEAAGLPFFEAAGLPFPDVRSVCVAFFITGDVLGGDFPELEGSSSAALTKWADEVRALVAGMSNVISRSEYTDAILFSAMDEWGTAFLIAADEAQNLATDPNRGPQRVNDAVDMVGRAHSDIMSSCRIESD